jgi:hypothetical protein
MEWQIGNSWCPRSSTESYTTFRPDSITSKTSAGRIKFCLPLWVCDFCSHVLEPLSPATTNKNVINHHPTSSSFCFLGLVCCFWSRGKGMKCQQRLSFIRRGKGARSWERTNKEIPYICDLPLLVASSSNVTSTALWGRCTYLTTEPRMKTFLTELCK